jgi:hypothetical protein
MSVLSFAEHVLLIRGSLAKHSFVQEAKAMRQKGKTDAIALNVTYRKSTVVKEHTIALKVPANNKKEFFVNRAWFEDLTGAQWVPNPFGSPNYVVGI